MKAALNERIHIREAVPNRSANRMFAQNTATAIIH
jgi:hypothetical protein